MFKVNAEDMEWEPYVRDGKEASKVKYLLREENARAENFYMRRFKIEPDAPAPLHRHAHEHQVYILRGEGLFLGEDGKTSPVKVGDAVFIETNELHGFKNTGDEPLEFICIKEAPKRAAERLRQVETKTEVSC